MVFTRLFSSRSFRIAQKLTSMSARQSQVAKRFIREMPRPMRQHDISVMECLAWVVLGGGPVLYMGIHFSNELIKLADDCESGRLAPGTGPEFRLTNDQWLQIKEAYISAHPDEDEDESEGCEMENNIETPLAVASTTCIPTTDLDYDYGKDRVLFIDAPEN